MSDEEFFDSEFIDQIRKIYLQDATKMAKKQLSKNDLDSHEELLQQFLHQIYFGMELMRAKPDKKFPNLSTRITNVTNFIKKINDVLRLIRDQEEFISFLPRRFP